MGIDKAEQGRHYWLSNSLNDYDFVLLLPHVDVAFNEGLLDILNKKLSEATRRYDVLVLTTVKVKESEKHETRHISKEMADALLLLYCMYEFTDKIIIGSFDLPHGRKLKNLSDCGIAHDRELIDKVIFGKIS